MRHPIWGLGVLLLVAFADPALGETKAGEGNWITRFFGGKKKEEPKRPRRTERTERAEAPSSRGKVVGAKTTYFRRLEVCNKLREVALQTGDDALMRRAEQLEVRVWDSYQDQLKHLARNRHALTPQERALDEHLGIEPREANRSRGRADVGAIRTVPGSGMAGRD